MKENLTISFCDSKLKIQFTSISNKQKLNKIWLFFFWWRHSFKTALRMLSPLFKKKTQWTYLIYIYVDIVSVRKLFIVCRIVQSAKYNLSFTLFSINSVHHTVNLALRLSFCHRLCFHSVTTWENMCRLVNSSA